MSKEFHRGNIYITRYYVNGERFQLHNDCYSREELHQLLLLLKAMLKISKPVKNIIRKG